MTKEQYPFWFFMLLLVGILWLFLRVFLPYINIFLWAIFLVITSYPLYQRLLKLYRGRDSLAACTMVLVLSLLIILPLILVILVIAQQSMDAYRMVSSQLNSPEFQSINDMLKHPIILKIQEMLDGYVDFERINLKNTIVSFLKYISNFLVDLSTTLFSSLAGFTLHFILFLVATYYFFKNGKWLLSELRKLSPLDSVKETKIIERFACVTQATILGNLATALIQGLLGGLGFLFTGLPSPLLWGTIMAFTSLLPVVGTLIIWGPAGLYLIFSGSPGRGVFLLLWSGIIVGLADNVIKPWIIKGKANLHPVIIFFSILGGISVYGFAGFILGPLIASLTFVFLEIYKEEFREQLPGTMKLSRSEIESALRRHDQE